MGALFRNDFQFQQIRQFQFSDEDLTFILPVDGNDLLPLTVELSRSQFEEQNPILQCRLTEHWMGPRYLLLSLYARYATPPKTK